MKKRYLLSLLISFALSMLSSCALKCWHESTIVDETVQATCTSHGLTEGSHCEICGETIIAQEVIEPLGHEVEIDNPVSPTCEEDGKTAGAHCKRCEEVLIGQDVVLHVGHSIVIDEVRPSTCIDYGLTEGSHCATCGKIIVAQEVIEPLGHDIVIDNAVDATCEQDGRTVGAHCSRCNQIIINQETIQHKGHNIVVDEKVEPTCTEHGLTEGSHCETCGKIIFPQEVIEPLGHNIVIDSAVNATCEEDGKTAGAHCSRCNQILINQEVVQHNGHNVIIDDPVEPTCTEHGLTEGSHCKTCGKILVPQEVIEPLGHDITIDDAVNATCEEDGKTAGAHCSRCNEIIIAQETIQHIGHKIVINEGVEPTCTEHGLTEGSYCETCGKILVPQEVIESLGHNYVINDPIESTCTEEGRTYGLTCSRCNSILIEQQCTEKKPHTKGKFLNFTIDSIANVHNPALYECEVCHQQYYDSIEKADIDIPIMSIDGDLSGISKDNKKQIMATYADDNQSFELNATLKLQGASSIGYPKKNYNIQFFKDNTFTSKQKVQLVDSWGKQNKYTLKANWVDFSEARNVVSAKIYGDIVHSRGINDQFNALTNGGAIDGYPILLFQNGAYQGLYTLNTSKDDYLFGMNGDENSREAILMVNDWSKTGRLEEHIPEDFGPTWELEYASTEDNEEIGTRWVSESFNEMMDFVNNNDGQDFKNGIEHYVNVPRAIDSMLFTWCIKATDNTSKNILWSTYDGIQWTPSVYDMDGSWGLLWNGEVSIDSSAWIQANGNVLWRKLYDNFLLEIKERWSELRDGPLSIQNVDKHFIDFYNLIPGELYKCERKKWADVPSKYNNHVTQVINWAEEMLKNIDSKFNIQKNEKLYKIQFISDENVITSVYVSNDYSKDSNQSTITYARNSDTGYLDLSDGQVNFKIHFGAGFELDNILISGSYKNLKGPSDTGIDNVYRVTKISSSLTISITSKSI